jgi:mono/diheme cytochrome c family protein
LKTYQLAAGLCCAVLLAFAVFAQTPPAESGLTENPVYRRDCAKCHGKTAKGRHFGGPSLISEKAAAASADDLRNSITNGKGHMPKFAGKLTSEEIDTLVKQIQSLNKAIIPCGP